MAALSVCMVGCAPQDFLSGGAVDWTEISKQYQLGKESSEPQTNKIGYRPWQHDIKEVEEAPEEELEEYDLTGPQNNGILKTDTEAVGTETASISSAEEDAKDADLYFYTAGNTSGESAGTVTLAVGKNGAEVSQVLVPTNEAALLAMTGAESVKSLSYSADDFQKMLMDYSETADKAYDKATVKGDWRAELGNKSAQKLNAYWNLDGSVEKKKQVTYQVGGSDKTAWKTGYCTKSGKSGYVSLDLLYQYYVNTNYDESVFRPKSELALANVDWDLRVDKASRQRAFLDVAKNIPVLNQMVFSSFYDKRQVTSGNKSTLGGYKASGKVTSYTLNCTFAKDSNLDIEKSYAENLKSFGQKMRAACGLSANCVSDADTGSTYHSLVSAGVEAMGSGAKAMVYVTQSSTDGVKVLVPQTAKESFKKALEEEEDVTVESVGSNVLESVGIKLKVVEVRVGSKVFEDEEKVAELAEAIASAVSSVYLNGGSIT